MDGGVEWKRIFNDTDVAKYVPDTFTNVVSMDPTNHLHLVVSFHIGCTGPYAGGCQAESNDGGDTWRLFKSPGESEGSGPIVLGPKTWLYTTMLAGVWSTIDDGASFQQVAGLGGGHYQLYKSPRGPYYMGTPQGVATSTDGLQWSVIPNSGGNIQGVVGTGKTIIASQQNGGHFYTASEDDPTNWHEMDTPGMPQSGFGAYFFQYDPDHHIIYGSMTQAGLWRVVVE
jgi:hypothetical protein